MTNDEITYDQINHAALLIFVITNEGFSQRMGEHFRTLAIKQKRAANMVLVVNKMDRTALGNVPEQQQVIYEDLKKVTTPYDPNDLYLSFVDTTSYFKAQDESDARRKNRRLERSGYDNFVANLNHFVAEKGVLQKINLPLNTIAAEIRNAASGSSDKDDFAAYAETIRHRKKILIDGKNECLDDIEIIISNFKTEISRHGRDTAESVTSKDSEDAAKKVLTAAQERVKLAAENCAEKISDRIKKFAEQTEQNLQTYENSTFVQQVNMNILKNFNVQGTSNFVTGGAAVLGVGGVAAGAFIAQQGGQIAAQFAKVAITPFGEFAGNFVSVGVATALKGTDAGILSGFIGKGAGELVKELPIFRAEPTMLNRIAQALTGNGSKIFGAAMAGVGVVFSIFMLHREGKKDEEKEKQLQQARREIISGFNDVAEDVGRELMKNVRTFMAQNIDSIVSNLDKQLNALESLTYSPRLKSGDSVINNQSF